MEFDLSIANKTKLEGRRTGEVNRWLGAQDALPEDPGSLPNTPMEAYNHL